MRFFGRRKLEEPLGCEPVRVGGDAPAKVVAERDPDPVTVWIPVGERERICGLFDAMQVAIKQGGDSFRQAKYVFWSEVEKFVPGLFGCKAEIVWPDGMSPVVKYWEKPAAQTASVAPNSSGAGSEDPWRPTSQAEHVAELRRICTVYWRNLELKNARVGTTYEQAVLLHCLELLLSVDTELGTLRRRVDGIDGSGRQAVNTRSEVIR